MTANHSPGTDHVADDEAITYVDQHRIACDGGGGALGHPKVYYSLDDNVAVCGYCDRKFIYDREKAAK